MEQKNEENVYIEKRIFVFSSFLLSVLVISSIFLIYLLLSNKISRINTFDSSTEPDIPAYENVDDNKTQEITYMLKEYNGKIGVYENEALVYTIDTYVFTLPETDKQLLRDGIVTADKIELYEIMEAYY